MSTFHTYSPKFVVKKLSATVQRILLFGESGIGKSTLAAELACELSKTDRSCQCISADPGSPYFGTPGAICLGRWKKNAWQLIALEALCTLDGGRFRLPLVAAVQRLTQGLEQGIVLIDAPGIVRSVAGAELLTGLVDATAVDLVLVLADDEKKLPLSNELATLGCEVVYMRPSSKARLPGKKKRAMHRTRLWDEYLRHAEVKTITIPASQLIGTPPALEAHEDWQGRQVALLKRGRTLAMGEILSVNQKQFQVRITELKQPPDQMLVRDAYRNKQGLLATFKRAGAQSLHYMPPPDVTPYPNIDKNTGPRPVVRIGDVTAVLVNGVFGDPLLHLRFHNRKRSILFDIGEGSRLPARLAHQVTDVFVSHAHFDHISGFFWLMRSRIGMLQPCRMFGPPGLSEHIKGMIKGIHWDRIGEGGPRFEIAELHDGHLLVYRLQAGKEEKEPPQEKLAPGGLLFEDPYCGIQAVTLNHGNIPVLAYRFELAPKINIRKEYLTEHNLTPGPWLGELKKQMTAGNDNATIHLPDNTTAAVGSLAEQLLLITPARKMVYATDLSDTEENLEKLQVLARGVHTFFCEAAFMEKDKKYAELSGHLTTSVCGKIARAANAEQLVPFHFSRRYENTPKQVYDEVKSVYKNVMQPDFF